jgi:hypothetical protein
LRWDVVGTAVEDAYGVSYDVDEVWADSSLGFWKNGTLQRLQDGLANVSVGLQVINEDAWASADFTLPFATGGPALLVNVDSADAPDPWNFLTPFKPIVWLAIFAFVALVSAVFWLVDRMSPHGYWRTGDDRAARHQLGLLNTMYFSGLTVLGKDTPGTPRSIAGRAAFLAFFVFFLFIQASYDSSLNALSVGKTLDRGIRTWDDVLSQGAPFGVLAGALGPIDCAKRGFQSGHVTFELTCPDEPLSSTVLAIALQAPPHTRFCQVTQSLSFG